MDLLKSIETQLRNIKLTPGKDKADMGPDPDGFQKPDKPKGNKTKKEEQEEKRVQEIPLDVLAS